MGCASCGGGNRHVTLYQVRMSSGSVKRYATEGEAWAVANSENKKAPDSASVEVLKVKSAP